MNHHEPYTHQDAVDRAFDRIRFHPSLAPFGPFDEVWKNAIDKTVFAIINGFSEYDDLEHVEAVAAEYGQDAAMEEQWDDAVSYSITHAIANPFINSRSDVSAAQREAAFKTIQEALIAACTPSEEKPGAMTERVRYAIRPHLLEALRTQAYEVQCQVADYARTQHLIGKAYDARAEKMPEARARFLASLQGEAQGDSYLKTLLSNHSWWDDRYVGQKLGDYFDRYYRALNLKISMGESYAKAHPGTHWRKNPAYEAGTAYVNTVTQLVADDLFAGEAFGRGATARIIRLIDAHANRSGLTQEFLLPEDEQQIGPHLLKIEPQPVAGIAPDLAYLFGQIRKISFVGEPHERWKEASAGTGMADAVLHHLRDDPRMAPFGPLDGEHGNRWQKALALTITALADARSPYEDMEDFAATAARWGESVALEEFHRDAVVDCVRNAIAQPLIYHHRAREGLYQEPPASATELRDAFHAVHEALLAVCGNIPKAEPLLQEAFRPHYKGQMRQVAYEAQREAIDYAFDQDLLGPDYRSRDAKLPIARRAFLREVEHELKDNPGLMKLLYTHSRDGRSVLCGELVRCFDSYYTGLNFKASIGETYSDRHPGTAWYQNPGYRAGSLYINCLTQQMLADLTCHYDLSDDQCLRVIELIGRHALGSGLIYDFLEPREQGRLDRHSILRIDPQPPEGEPPDFFKLLRTIRDESFVDGARARWRARANTDTAAEL